MAKYIRYQFMGQPLIDWNIEEMCGYKPVSTYYTDFGISERFGEKAIRETFDNALKFWGEDIKWATEIVMVTNWKIWEHWHSGNEKLARFYDGLWREAQQYVFEHFEGNDEAMEYYFRTTD